jgi:hemoglobin
MVRKFASLCLAVAMVGALAAPAVAQQSGDSLYKRLGGYDAIAAVTDDFIARLATDPQTSKFFLGFSDDSKKRIRQHVVDFLCQATGGPCIYLGRDMKTAHAGSRISDADWDAGIRALTATLDKFKVGQRERTDVLNALGPLKNDIVTVH